MNKNIKTVGKVIIFIMTVIAIVSFIFCVTYEITNSYIKLISIYSGTWLSTVILVNLVSNLIEDDKK